MAFAVPAGVDSLSVAATGGAGGDLTNGSGTTLVPGGRAALVTGVVAVFPGEQLQLTVASNGGTANASTGTNGGGGTPDGGAGGYQAGGGGGATRILACQGVICPVAVIAGGGGGAGSSGYISSGSTFSTLPGGPGGAAGVRGTDGASDVPISGGSGGQPGTAAAAGAGGSGLETGGIGSGPTGGAGGSPGPFTLHEGGGGGGGGVFGAGGGGSGGSGMDPSSNQAVAGGGGGGGGSSLAPSGASLNLAAPGAAPGIVLTWTPPGGPGSSPGPSPSGGGVAVVSGETLSPSAFPAAPSGPSALASARRRYGARVAYTLNQAADVSFTVVQRQPGRMVNGGVCAKPAPSNSSAPRCTRRVTRPGSFTRAGSAGANSFRFTGRLAGRKLKPGKYQLLATPGTGAKTGQAASASFRIID
jgi:hypothetical protein